MFYTCRCEPVNKNIKTINSFKLKQKTIMKKSLIFCAALFACAFAFQSCDQVKSDNPATVDEATYDLQNLTFAQYIEKHTVGDVLTLPAGAEVTIDEEISLDKDLYIVSDRENPAKITAKAGFITNSSLSFDGVDIDASAIEKPFIQLTAFTLGSDEVSKKIDLIAFIGSKISGLKYQFIYANKQSYLVDCINVQKSIIAIDGANKKTTFDFNGGGNVAFLGIDESTIYSVPTVNNNGGFFSSQSSKEVTDLGGTTQTFAISNSTLYNITNAKTVNSLRKNSQAYQKFAVKNSIIVNSGKSGQFLAGLNAGQKGKAENWEVSGNMINFDGGDVSAAEAEKIGIEISPKEGVVEFADADKGNFTQKQTSAGDPRWIANAQ